MSGSSLIENTEPVNDADEPIGGLYDPELDNNSDLQPEPQSESQPERQRLSDTPNAPLVGQNTDTEPEQSVEDKARAKGWKPVSEWSGDPSTHVSAEEFLKRGIESKSVVVKERDDLTEEVRQMRMAQEQDRADARRREAQIAINAQRQAREHYERIAKQARTENDFATYDEAIKRANQAGQQESNLANQQQQVELSTPDPVFDSFVERNPWYSSNAVLAKVADEAGHRIAEQEGLRGQPLLDKVEQNMREVYPHLFQNPKRQTAPAVESGSGQGKAAGRSSVSSLGSEYVTAFNDFYEDFGRDFKNRSEAEAHYVKMITGGQ